MAIRVEIQLADGQFVTRMLHAGESVERFNQNLLRAYPSLQKFAQGGLGAINSIERADAVSQSFTGTLRQMALAATAATAAIGGGQILKEIVQINSEFENMNMLMQSMSQAENKELDAKNQVQALREEAMKAPFSLHALQQAAVKLSSVGLKPLDGSLRAIENAVAAVGGGDEKLERVTLAITQMSGKGVIQLEELRQQLGEALPQATELMARSMGLTMAELLQKISTGTVAAKPALAGLFLEMERTFGGQAERMMSTFSGQITRTTALLQGLALNFGNVTEGSDQATFFGELKKQLNDINNFLSSEFAGNIARSLNTALVSAVQGLRSMVDWLIDARYWLYDIGKAALYAFALFMGGKLVSAIATAFTAMITKAQLARLQYQALGAELTRINALQAASSISMVSSQGTQLAMGLAQIRAARAASMIGPQLPAVATAGATSALVTGATAMSRYNLAMAAGAAIMPRLISGFVGLASVAPLLGLAIYAVGDYFDLFGNKARNAWQELEQFGAKSMEQVNNALPLLDAEIAKLEALKRQRNEIATQPQVEMNWGEFQTAPAAPSMTDLDAEIAGQEAKVKRRQEFIERMKRDARKAEAEAEKNIRLTAVNDELEGIRTAYVKAQNEQNAQHQERLKQLQNEQKDIEGEKKAHEEALTKIALKSYDERAAIFAAEISRLQAQLTGANEAEAAIINAMLNDLNDRYGQILSERGRFIEKGIGVTTIDPAVDFEKLEEKGKKALEAIREESMGLIYDLKGASGAMGELQQAIDSGRYGPQENATIATLIEQLKEAQSQADELNQLIDDQNRYDRDVAANKKRLMDDIFEATHKNSNETEKLIARYNMGFYGMAGKTAMQTRIEQLQEAIKATNGTVTNAAETFKKTMFSDDMNSRANTLVGWVNKLVDALQGVASGVMSVNGAMNQFRGGGGSMGMSFTGPMLTSADITQAAKKGMLDLIAAAEGTDRGRGYNETLGYGQFTGGPVDLVNMTLNQVRDLQRAMLAHPENNFNSSAVGRYQIVGDTLERLIDKLGLDRNQKFTPELQDMLARELLKGREGQGLAGLRQEWEGLYRVADKTIELGLQNTQAAGNPAAPGGAAAPAPSSGNFVNGMLTGMKDFLGADVMRRLEQNVMRVGEAYKQVFEDINARDDVFRDLEQGAAALNEELKAGETRASKFIAMVERQNKEGKGAFANLVPGSAEYNKILDAAKAYDAAEKSLKEYREALSDAKTGNEEMNKIAKQTAIDLENSAKKAKDPFSSIDTSKLDELKRKLDAIVEAQLKAFGPQSDQYTQAVVQRDAIMTAAQNAFADERIASQKQEAEQTRRSTLSKRQQLDLQIQDIRRQTQGILAVEGLTQERRAEIIRQGNAQIQALMEQFNANNPFQQQLKQWQQLGENFSQVMTNAASSLADGITAMIMGEEVDWKAMLKNVLKDLVNMGVKYLMSSLMGGKGQVAGAMKGMGGKGMGGGKGKMAGVAHTGGIVGRAGNFKRVSPTAFAGARRFHAGGIIQNASRRVMKDGLTSGEVPIIALRGEGVFTEEQMGNLAAAIGYNGAYSPSAMSKHASRLTTSMKKMQKYHVGGIVGKGVDLGASGKDVSSMGSKLDETSLKAMNDNRSSNTAVTNNITVNGANGSDAKANEELAKTISREVEQSVRGMVYKEMRAQMRPGNMLGR